MAKFRTIGFLLALTLNLTSSLQAHTLQVVLASTNKVKQEAVQAAFDLIAPKATVDICAFEAASGIAPQPLGLEAAKLGATNRLASIPDALAGQADYLVAIENYIAFDSGNQLWEDYAYVLIREVRSAKDLMGLSQGTPFPSRVLEPLSAQTPESLVQSQHGYSVTVGSILQAQAQKEGRMIDPTDWHLATGAARKSRKGLIVDALWKAFYHEEIAALKTAVKDYPNFPKGGVLFKDFLPLLADAESFQNLTGLLAKRLHGLGVEGIVGLEARGFIIGAALAQKMGLPFYPVRKEGKLPGAVLQVSYEKEYGTDRFELAAGSIKPGQKLVLVDDLIATGGSARAAIELVQNAGGEVLTFMTLLEVSSFKAYQHLSVPLFNLIDE